MVEEELSKLSQLAANIMRENYKSEIAEEARKEIVGLIDDFYNTWDELSGKSKKIFLESALALSISYRLSPLAYSIFYNFLIGDSPPCFMELRLIIETLAKAIYADRRYSKKTAFHKLECLESFLENGEEGKPISMSKFFKSYLPEATGEELANEINTLWHQLSRDWLHLKGYVNKLIDRIQEMSQPSWSIGVPVVYEESDKRDLNELQEMVKKTRKIFARGKSSWSDFYFQCI
jgi:hypothetical protein